MNQIEYEKLLKRREYHEEQLAAIDRKVSAYNTFLQENELRFRDALYPTDEFILHMVQTVHIQPHMLAEWLQPTSPITVGDLDSDDKETIHITIPGLGFRIPMPLAKDMRAAWLLEHSE